MSPTQHTVSVPVMNPPFGPAPAIPAPTIPVIPQRPTRKADHKYGLPMKDVETQYAELKPIASEINACREQSETLMTNPGDTDQAIQTLNRINEKLEQARAELQQHEQISAIDEHTLHQFMDQIASALTKYRRDVILAVPSYAVRFRFPAKTLQVPQNELKPIANTLRATWDGIDDLMRGDCPPSVKHNNVREITAKLSSATKELDAVLVLNPQLVGEAGALYDFASAMNTSLQNYQHQTRENTYSDPSELQSDTHSIHSTGLTDILRNDIWRDASRNRPPTDGDARSRDSFASTDTEPDIAFRILPEPPLSRAETYCWIALGSCTAYVALFSLIIAVFSQSAWFSTPNSSTNSNNSVISAGICLIWTFFTYNMFTRAYPNLLESCKKVRS